MTFDGSTIVAPCAIKPHIVMRVGLWRVSHKPRFLRGVESNKWTQAHKFISRLNSPLMDEYLRRPKLL